MNVIYIAFLLIYTCCSITSTVNAGLSEKDCATITQLSGDISYFANLTKDTNKCWNIKVPENSFVQIDLKELQPRGRSCPYTNIKLRMNGTSEIYKFCPDGKQKTITAFRDVNVHYYSSSSTAFANTSFQLSFSKGISLIKGIKESRINAISWLMKYKKNYGWGKNTHRAMTALYLTKVTNFTGHDDKDEIDVKRLQLKISASLQRNSCEVMSANELSMYVNALLVTCHDVRNIFSEDLLKTLATRAFSSSSVTPGAYLTLCNTNWQFSEKNVQQLVNPLTKDIGYPFALEFQAMTVMALSCLNRKTTLLDSVYNASSIYSETVRNLMLNQKEDGSFGNVHTTATVTQALISSRQAGEWNVVNALSFLMKSLSASSADFLTVYLTLPLFEGRSLMDISNDHCLNYKRKLGEEDDILEDSQKIDIQYSLWVGYRKNIINHIDLKVPGNSTVYEVMKIAEKIDPKYKFSHYESNGHLYVYEIGSLTNDMEAGQVWKFYIEPRKVQEFTESPDQITMKDKEHLIMWYGDANI